MGARNFIAGKNKTTTKQGQVVGKQPTFTAVAKRGIKTVSDLNALMGALIVDLGEGTVNANTGNVVVKSASVMVTNTALQLKYGGRNRSAALQLA